MSGTATISGVISGLNTDEILQKLETLARVPVVRLQVRKATLSAQLSAWQTVNSRLLSLKEKAAALAAYSTFSTKSAASSNESLVGATVTGSPAAAEYSFTIDSIAKAHRVSSQGYADETTLVGDGTVEIAVGDGDAVSLQADGLSLAGLREAINNSDAGVYAFLVNDGSADTPYRLVITSKTTGTDGEMTITANLTGGAPPTFSDLQAATDASLSLGGGLTVTRSSNTITDLIPGVTLQLRDDDAAQTVTVTVSADTAGIKQKIQDFVTQYNDLVSYVEAQWKYDAESDQAGTLFGEFTLYAIQDNLVSRLTSPISGLPSSLSLLSQVGITLGTNGKLSLDETVLQDKLESDLNGVMRLFSRSGQASNANVIFASATSDAKPSGETGYAVQITQTATRARVTAGAAQTDPLAADEVLTIRGVAISLTAGMTQSQVIAAINSKKAETGVTASATDATGSGSGNYLTLTSAGYGSNAEVTAVSDKSNGSAGNSGVGNVLVTESDPDGESGNGTGAAGLDVAGTINGEAAEGSGQILESTAGDSKGLSLIITATAAGSYGTVVYTAGAGASLDDMLSFLTESENGSVKVAQESLQERIENIDEDITKTEAAITRQQDRLLRQFSAMESALGRLQAQSSFIVSQVAQIQSNWKGA